MNFTKRDLIVALGVVAGIWAGKKIKPLIKNIL